MDKEKRFVRIERDGMWWVAVVRDEWWATVFRGEMRLHKASAVHDGQEMAIEQRVRGYEVH